MPVQKENASMDKIHIEGLKLRCIIGVYPRERVKKQAVNIFLTLMADLRRAGQSDRLEDTVDYKKLKAHVRQFVENSHFLLVEKLANEIARICLEASLVKKVIVRIEKPAALRFVKTVAIEIERSAADFLERTQ